MIDMVQNICTTILGFDILSNHCVYRLVKDLIVFSNVANCTLHWSSTNSFTDNRIDRMQIYFSAQVISLKLIFLFAGCNYNY